MVTASASGPSDLEGRVAKLLARAYELATSRLEGINEAAEELAAMAGGELAVISQARRVVLQRFRDDPTRVTHQVVWLIRRAIEKGAWQWRWEDTRPVP